LNLFGRGVPSWEGWGWIMHYQTVKDVISQCRQLHQDIAGLYAKLSEDQVQERVAMLLEYLRRHEVNLEHSLDKFENDKSQKILDRWLQYAPDHDLEDTLSSIKISDHMNTDQVVDMAFKLDDYFIDLYQEMVDHSLSTSLKAVFQNLLDMEQHQKIRMAKTVLQINDL
jgi:hypothetical protein